LLTPTTLRAGGLRALLAEAACLASLEWIVTGASGAVHL
jgi:hypothetical protein